MFNFDELIPLSYYSQVNKKRMKASEVAKILDVKPVTVRAWLKKGLFPNAELKETILGKVWLVPENDLKNFRRPQKGRPNKKKNRLSDF